MTIGMNIHGTASITAQAHHAIDCEDPCHWLVLNFVQKPRLVGEVTVLLPDHTITVFLSDSALTERLAAAINGATARPSTSPNVLAPSPNDYRD